MSGLWPEGEPIPVTTPTRAALRDLTNFILMEQPAHVDEAAWLQRLRTLATRGRAVLRDEDEWTPPPA